VPRHPLGNRDLIRAINRSTVLNTVKSKGPISRTEITRHTGLSAATITAISAQLIKNNLIFEKEEGDSRGGRRPILLALNPNGGFVTGLKLTEDNITGVLTDLEATVLAKHTGSIQDHSLENVILTIGEVVDHLLAETRIARKQFLGVGIGLAGIVDGTQGVLRHSPIFGWRDIPLSMLLESRLGVSVFIDNDVNTLTITEQWFGSGQGIDNFLTVTVGRGVGLGIVLNGQLYRGATGGAGEFGHTVVDPKGPACDCGKRGCLERYVSDPALLRMAAEDYSRGVISKPVADVEELLEAAQSGDRGACQIYAHAGEMFGRGIANLINILNPSLLIISGEGARAGDVLFEPMQAAIQTHTMPGLVESTRIQIDDWDDYAWARGAAGLVLHGIFESPFHQEAAIPLS